jgi:hypothetical protein
MTPTLDNLEKEVNTYFDIIRDFDLENKLLLYTNFDSKENGIITVYKKRPGVTYIPFIKNSYPITLTLKDV